MIKKLPVIELDIDPESGAFVSAIALVENPAVERNFIAFSEDSAKANHFEFEIQSEEKQELLGVAMRADMNIYRRDQKTNYEYYSVFKKNVVRKTAQNFLKNGFTKETNIEHSAIPAGSYIYQSYIVDESKGMVAPTGLGASDGDWIIGLKVEDKDVWNLIKTGQIKGFSIEGMFTFLDTNEFADFEFNTLQHSNDVLAFSKELEIELDAIIAKFNL